MTKNMFTKLAILSLLVLPIYYVLICGSFLLVGQFNMSDETVCPMCIIRPTQQTYPDGTPLTFNVLPEIYMWPSVGMMRSITFDADWFDAKLFGIVVAGLAPAMLLTLAFQNWAKSPNLGLITLGCICPIILGLAWIGVMPAESPYTDIGLVLTIGYYAYFLGAVPLLGYFRQTKD